VIYSGFTQLHSMVMFHDHMVLEQFTKGYI
jgi:hypothetical protein